MLQLKGINIQRLTSVLVLVAFLFVNGIAQESKKKVLTTDDLSAPKPKKETVEKIPAEVFEVGGVEWNMTGSEVFLKFQSVATRLPKREIFQTFYAEQVIRDRKILNKNIKITFQMGKYDDLLRQVLIKFEEEDLTTSKKTFFQNVERLLVKKYGAIAGTEEQILDSSDGSASYMRRWILDTTTVELSYTFINRISNDVTIRFFPNK
jgi:hypothetical protein